MKKDGKYKMNLQFPAETEKQIRAGEFLERLGHKKSAIVVEAVNGYMDQHPELVKNDFKVEIHSKAVIDREMLEKLVRDMVMEHFSHMESQPSGTPVNMIEENLDDDIAKMLDNLDFFQ